ncbi:hypothetical protein AALC17_15190 [Oscillospiraceae bacterium 38-13]
MEKSTHKKVRVEFSLEDMDMSEFKKSVTYGKINAYMLEKFGLKVSSLYISQVKRKCELEVGDNYNHPLIIRNQKTPRCLLARRSGKKQSGQRWSIFG